MNTARLDQTSTLFNCIKLVFRKEGRLIIRSNALFYINYSILQAVLAPIKASVKAGN